MKKQFTKVMMIAGILACSLLTLPGYAQKMQHTPEERAKRMTDSLKSNLALTDSQYSKILQLNVDYLKQMQSLRKQDGTKEQKMESFKTLRKTHNKDVAAVLTKEQTSKFRTMREERKEQRNGRRDQDSTNHVQDSTDHLGDSMSHSQDSTSHLQDSTNHVQDSTKGS